MISWARFDGPRAAVLDSHAAALPMQTSEA
jgi:hypothetical protein